MNIEIKKISTLGIRRCERGWILRLVVSFSWLCKFVCLHPDSEQSPKVPKHTRWIEQYINEIFATEKTNKIVLKDQNPLDV